MTNMDSIGLIDGPCLSRLHWRELSGYAAFIS